MASDSLSSYGPENKVIQEYKCLDIRTANVLIIGVTGAGKSTFVTTLKDFFFHSKPSVESQTQIVIPTDLLFNIDGEYFKLQVIDTPGFNDNRKGKSDLDIEDLILNFVKKGIKELNLVLIALPLNQKYNSATIKSIMSVLRFLGPTMRPITALLLSHAEACDQTTREKWVYEMGSTKGTQGLVQFCNEKVFYTGMWTPTLNKASFLEVQIRDHRQIINAAMNTQAIPIGGEAPNMINKFQVHESAAKDSLVVKRYLPELKRIIGDLSANKFSDLNHESYKFYMDYITELESAHLEERMLEWNKLPVITERYLEEAKGITSASRCVRSTFAFCSYLEDIFDIVQNNILLGLNVDVEQELADLNIEFQAWKVLYSADLAFGPAKIN